MRLIALALVLSCFACKPRDDSDPETWIRRLDDRDAKMRVKAVQQLRKLKAKQAAPRVAALLKDPLVKEEAALALQDIGGRSSSMRCSTRSIPPWRRERRGRRAAHRTNARIAEALGNIGDPRAGPALLRLARTTDDNVRLAAVEGSGTSRPRRPSRSCRTSWTTRARRRS